MSNIHHIHQGTTPQPKKRTRGPYRKKATASDIERAIRTAEKLGLTIYGFTVEGEKVHLQTKPTLDDNGSNSSAAEEWFAHRG